MIYQGTLETSVVQKFASDYYLVCKVSWKFVLIFPPDLYIQFMFLNYLATHVLETKDKRRSWRDFKYLSDT